MADPPCESRKVLQVFVEQAVDEAQYVDRAALMPSESLERLVEREQATNVRPSCLPSCPPTADEFAR